MPLAGRAEASTRPAYTRGTLLQYAAAQAATVCASKEGCRELRVYAAVSTEECTGLTTANCGLAYASHGVGHYYCGLANEPNTDGTVRWGPVTHGRARPCHRHLWADLVGQAPPKVWREQHSDLTPNSAHVSTEHVWHNHGTGPDKHRWVGGLPRSQGSE